jgi:hypothetical protein
VRRPGYAPYALYNIPSTVGIKGLHVSEETLWVVQADGVIKSGSNSLIDGTMQVADRPNFATYLGDVLICAGGRPVALREGVVRRLGTKLEPPSSSVTVTGEGRGGRDWGYWVYAVSFLTSFGETPIGPASAPALIESPNARVRVSNIPQADQQDNDLVIARRIYAARASENGQQTSEFFLVTEVGGNQGGEILEYTQEDQFGEGPTPDDFDMTAPDGAKYILQIGDFVVVAGHNKHEFVFSSAGTHRIFPPENIRHVERDDGYITGLARNGNTLVVFKSNSIELFGVVGNNINFVRRQVLDIGCIAPETIVQVDSRVFFVGHDLELYALSQEGPQKLTIGNRTWFLDEPVPQNLRALLFRNERRVRLYGSQDTNLVWDYGTNSFTKEAGMDDSGRWARLKLSNAVSIFDKTYIALEEDPNLYEWSDDFATDNGDPIMVHRRLRFLLTATGRKAKLNRLKFRIKGDGTPAQDNLKPPFLKVEWQFDEGGPVEKREVFIQGGCQNGYFDITNMGCGHEVELTLRYSNDHDLVLTSGYAMVEELGR